MRRRLRYGRWVVAAGLGCALVIVAARSVNAGLRPADRASVATPAAPSRVSLGKLTLWLARPAYRAVAPSVDDVIWLTIHVEAHNEAEQVVVVAARDLVLVNARGGLFPPAWGEPNGALRDGFGDPAHTLLALGPGGRTELDLAFLVRGGGPFSLRYLHSQRTRDQAVPTVVPLT